MAGKTPRYMETVHVCRQCGSGRILIQTNSGPTGGGNPVYKCATCDNGGAVISRLCYCGFERFENDPNLYSCWDINKPIPDGWKEFRRLYSLRVIKTIRLAPDDE